MLQTSLRPMGIGRILDRSFQMYRKHFIKLTLIMLILYGPYYLLQNLLLYHEASMTTSTILDQIREGSSWQEILQSGSLQNAASPQDIWKGLLFGLVLLPLFLLGLMPASIASVVHLSRAELLGEAVPGVGALLKRSFRRFWPLVASMLLNMVIMFGMYIGFVLVLVVLGIVFAIGSGISGVFNASGGGTVAFAILFLVLLVIGFLLAFAYFVIRWCYSLAVVAIGEDPIGLSQSWKLTRKQFWRLFLMYLVLTIILYLFLTVIQLLVTALLGVGLTSQILNSLISLLVSPLWLLPYGISFFDLKVRNEGLGLEAMIEAVTHAQAHNEPQDGQINVEPSDSEDDNKPEDSDKKNE